MTFELRENRPIIFCLSYSLDVLTIWLDKTDFDIFLLWLKENLLIYTFVLVFQFSLTRHFSKKKKKTYYIYFSQNDFFHV